jgi:hypothetical protein
MNDALKQAVADTGRRRSALEEVLQRKGFWPPPPAQDPEA